MTGYFSYLLGYLARYSLLLGRVSLAIKVNHIDAMAENACFLSDFDIRERWTAIFSGLHRGIVFSVRASTRSIKDPKKIGSGA
ncbi:protein of unknown function [Burkholderia multivorans]